MTEGPALAVFGHPDDAEISVGGTLVKWAATGREVHLLILTNGDRGSSDAARDRAELAATRAAESEAAGVVMGLSSVRILGVHDGELENNVETRAEVVRAIRELRPTTVVSCDPTAWFFENRYYNHSDHRTAGVIALDAVFPGAGNPHYFGEHIAEGLDVRQVNDVWLGWSLEPNHREDVTERMDRKLAALHEHKSQLEMFGYFEDWVREDAERIGRVIGVRYGEAFRVLDLE